MATVLALMYDILTFLVGFERRLAEGFPGDREGAEGEAVKFVDLCVV